MTGQISNKYSMIPSKNTSEMEQQTDHRVTHCNFLLFDKFCLTFRVCIIYPFQSYMDLRCGNISSIVI